MPSSKLTSVSSLGPLASRSANIGIAPGVFITERTDICLCSLLARKGAEAALTERVREVFGVALPHEPRHTGTTPAAFAWAGPSQWLALGVGPSQPFELQLRSSLADVASVMDQSDGRTIVRIGGPRARDTLAKGVHIDLHPSVFRPGDTAITIVSYIGVHFWQVDSTPTYEFAMFRSFAISFWEWLVNAAAEFGVSVGWS
ncbi:MAG TPA: sarcosine oxidase subunit gamma family protein [Xanthobacteraceae bacterium]|nr:sarcosine oxidase subunit gamma family protein [Xanthobacteraceae bacterium]